MLGQLSKWEGRQRRLTQSLHCCGGKWRRWWRQPLPCSRTSLPALVRSSVQLMQPCIQWTSFSSCVFSSQPCEWLCSQLLPLAQALLDVDRALQGALPERAQALLGRLIQATNATHALLVRLPPLELARVGRATSAAIDPNAVFRLRSAALTLTLHLMPRAARAQLPSAPADLQRQYLHPLVQDCAHCILQLDEPQTEGEQREAKVLRATVAAPARMLCALRVYVEASMPLLAPNGEAVARLLRRLFSHESCRRGDVWCRTAWAR